MEDTTTSINGLDIRVIENGDGTYCFKVDNRKDHRTPFYSHSFSQAQAPTAIITPTAGKRLIINDIHIKTEAVIGELKLDFLTSGIIVDREYFSAFTSGTPSGMSDLIIKGGIDEPLTFETTTGSKGVFIAIQYIER